MARALRHAAPRHGYLTCTQLAVNYGIERTITHVQLFGELVFIHFDKFAAVQLPPFFRDDIQLAYDSVRVTLAHLLKGAVGGV